MQKLSFLKGNKRQEELYDRALYRNRAGILLAILFLFSSAAFAGDPSGVWTSTSGSTIKLWANMQQVMVTVTTPQGQSFKYNGWWTRFSDNFAYQNNSGTFYASFANSNQINVKDPSGKWFTWTRGVNNNSAPVQQQPSNSGISGNWQSSSGSMIQVSTNGNQIVVNIVGRDGKRFQGIGRWLQFGRTFDYSIAGFAGTAQCTVASSRQINVLYGGTWTTWSR
ncbi:MAG: hypothetical protein CVV42_16620 [Candidatus Riflebacteria bacterium HGW-Riflebacteria-2]|jgi:hypothetical protein|nr:MAG: hypothetical protein CVV42_16620 [Candidatus Riflebacteria bacterium HGW-Riflebacteria-2]